MIAPLFPPRVVVDTNVLLDFWVFEDPRARPLREALESGRIQALRDGATVDELAEVLLDDVALAFELLRAVNTAQVRGAQLSGSGPVLTIRRSIAMIGLEGVRRVALASLPVSEP